MLRGIAENMVAVVNTALKCFSGMQELRLGGEGAINTQVSVCLLQQKPCCCFHCVRSFDAHVRMTYIYIYNTCKLVDPV